MLFIAFIENAFKHGGKTKAHRPFIHISFNVESPDRVQFIIENNVDPSVSLSLEEKKISGFGLTNVKKRLELLYPGRHELHIASTETIYRVEMCICIKES